MTRWQATVLLLACLTRCHGYRFFQDRIPNGKFVPHPCKIGFNWEGVGHEEEQGGGVRNSFGRDFYENGKKWDRTLCLLDSDEDGRTNGEELGDPDCVWEVGQQPAHNNDLSHPGICDPWNSQECKDRTKFVRCDSGKLDCPAKDEPGVKNVTIRMPETKVPARETTYKCVVFDFPQDGDYHLIANEPIIANMDIMHHTLLFGCDSEDTEHRPGEPYDCEMEVDKNCFATLGIWSFGMAGECAHPQMGFRIGTRGYKRGVIQLHWNNPQERADYVDSSGLILYLTTNLRPNNAGILTVGQDFLMIPPGQEKVSAKAVCSSECSRTLLKDDIKMTVALNHMHGLGIRMRVEQIRDGRKLRDLAHDPEFDYDTPVLHAYTTPITIKPGDEIRTECVFKSTSRTKTTFFGEGTYDEMCYGFLTYYPKENIDLPLCTSYKEVTNCAFNISDVIDGCSFDRLHDLTHPETKKTFDLVMDHCSPYIGCRQECLPVARRLKQSSCYGKGTVNDWARYTIDQNAADVDKMRRFYAALDSCDTELALEQVQEKECPKIEINEKLTSGSPTPLISLCSVVLAIFINLFP